MISLHREDTDKIIDGETVTVWIPELKWTLVIGYDKGGTDKYTVSVNVDISALPEAPMTAAS